MRIESRVKLALNSPPLSSTREPLRLVCSTQSHLLFRQRNNMSTTTKLLKNSRSFECSNRKLPLAVSFDRRTNQATFGTIFNWSTAGSVSPCIRVNGGGERDRTDDPLLAKQVLSQLSYTPEETRCITTSARHGFPWTLCEWWVWMDSNHRPPPYQDGALTS